MPTKPIELIFRPHFRGGSITKTTAGAGQAAGITALGSGANTVTVSTTIVNSDSLIWFGIKSSTRIDSGTYFRPVEVSSVVPGVSFAFTTADGANINRNVDIMWEIVRAS